MSVQELEKIFLDKIEQDYAAGVFKTITPFATLTFKHEMETIEEVFACITAHEGLHLGVANALKRIVNIEQGTRKAE